MATPSIMVGVLTTIVQNTIYALPPRVVKLYTSATTPTIQQSSDVAFATSTAVTLTDGTAEIAGAFLRCTTGNIAIIIKPF